jgi:RNA polymerase sigma-B factor
MPSSVPPAQRRRDEALLRDYRQTCSDRILRELVERYRPLARSLAMRYRAASEPLEDLLQVADLGLVAAIKGYDPDRGKPFTAYAVPTILGELRHHFRDKVWNLRLPRALQESTAKVDRATDRLTQSLGRAPTVDEIAEHTELESGIVVQSLSAAQVRYTLSLDGVQSDSDEPPAIAQLGTTESGYDRIEAKLASKTAGLTEDELTILRMRFQQGMTQRDIGAELGVSQMQVSRVSRAAVLKLIAAVRGEQSTPVIRVAKRARRLEVSV